MKQTAQDTPAARPAENSARNIWLAAFLLILAGTAAWSNSFHGPFVFDDVGTILNNPTILKLWPPWDALLGQADGATSSGRPLVNLSLAINYALGGFDVRGYHVFNLSLHLAAGLALFGVVRRTLQLETLRARFGPASLQIAFLSAALWLLHPLQTAAVTYIVQRAEVLASLFYLLTLYAFLRATSSAQPLRWKIISVTSCLCGMASKEVAVSAPLFVFLFDRTLASSSFADAWRRNRGYYLALASTWILLVALVLNSHGRGGSVGGSESITPWTYLLTQCQAIVHYLRLVIWPSPLVFDYGTATVTSLTTVLPQALLLWALAAGTLFAVWKRSPLGLAGTWFLILLAPSSSVVPIVTQTMAEHRVYLALAAILSFGVALAIRLGGPRITWAFLALAALAGLHTFQRNTDYCNPIALWTDTAEKLPTSKRAHNNLGTSYFIAGHIDDAVASFQRALTIDPRYAGALVNLGRVQLLTERHAEAAANFQKALLEEPANAVAHFGFGFALTSQGYLAEGIARYREAIRLEPKTTDYRLKLAQALFRADEPAAAITEFRALLALAPALVEAHSGLGTVLASQGQFAEAERELREALLLNPADFDAHYNLANALAQQQRVAEAVPHYEAALRIRPDHAGARQILEQAREYLRSSK